MKLEVGMLVKRRDGVKGKVIVRLDESLEVGDLTQPWVIQWRGFGVGTYSDDGSYYPSGTPDQHDAVEEWREPPRKWEVWLYEPLDRPGAVQFSVNEHPFLCNRILSHATLTEGEGA